MAVSANRLELLQIADAVAREKAIDKEIRDIVSKSAEFAQNDPEQDASELYTDIIN